MSGQHEDFALSGDKALGIKSSALRRDELASSRSGYLLPGCRVPIGIEQEKCGPKDRSGGFREKKNSIFLVGFQHSGLLTY